MSGSKSTPKDQFDISKALASRVRVSQNGRAKNMPQFEAEVRQHLAKAVKQKSVPSMRWLIELGIKYGLLAKPRERRSHGVIMIPKDIPEAYQKEIFDFQPEPGERDLYQRIATIISRWFEEREQKTNDGERNEQ